MRTKNFNKRVKLQLEILKKTLKNLGRIEAEMRESLEDFKSDPLFLAVYGAEPYIYQGIDLINRE